MCMLNANRLMGAGDTLTCITSGLCTLSGTLAGTPACTQSNLAGTDTNNTTTSSETGGCFVRSCNDSSSGTVTFTHMCTSTHSTSTRVLPVLVQILYTGTVHRFFTRFCTVVCSLYLLIAGRHRPVRQCTRFRPRCIHIHLLASLLVRRRRRQFKVGTMLHQRRQVQQFDDPSRPHLHRGFRAMLQGRQYRWVQGYSSFTIYFSRLNYFYSQTIVTSHIFIKCRPYCPSNTCVGSCAVHR